MAAPGSVAEGLLSNSGFYRRSSKGHDWQDLIPQTTYPGDQTQPPLTQSTGLFEESPYSSPSTNSSPSFKGDKNLPSQEEQPVVSTTVEALHDPRDTERYYDQTSPPLVCRLCSAGEEFSSTRKLVAHFKEHGIVLFKCPNPACTLIAGRKGLTSVKTLVEHFNARRTTCLKVALPEVYEAGGNAREAHAARFAIISTPMQ